MRLSGRSRSLTKVTSRIQGDSQNKAMPIFLLISLICLLIAHFNFNKFYWLFIVGLLVFSFTTACSLVTMLEQFLPTGLVSHRLWSGVGIGGKGLAGLIIGILAIAIMVGVPFLLMKMDVHYIK
jgi:hypothetical protein